MITHILLGACNIDIFIFVSFYPYYDIFTIYLWVLFFIIVCISMLLWKQQFPFYFYFILDKIHDPATTICKSRLIKINCYAYYTATRKICTHILWIYIYLCEYAPPLTEISTKENFLPFLISKHIIFPIYANEFRKYTFKYSIIMV